MNLHHKQHQTKLKYTIKNKTVMWRGKVSGKKERVTKSTYNMLIESFSKARVPKFEKLNPDKVTTRWNNSYLFSNKEDALKELELLKMISEEINKTFSPEFGNLSGPVLLDYLETEKEFSRSIIVKLSINYTFNLFIK